MSNPMSAVGLPDWQWATCDRDTQIRWLALGHTHSPAGHPLETLAVTPDQWMAAARIVDTYNTNVLGQPVAPWTLSMWPIPAGSQAVTGAPPVLPPPVVIPPPPPPALPLAPRAGEPCPTCGHICPR